jgi:hypothetical protein
LIASDSTIFAIVNILVMEFDMLSKDFKSAIDEGDERRVRDLIKRHQKLISIFAEIADIFSLTFMCSFFIGAASVSVSGFQLATSNDWGEIGYCIPYTLGSMSQIFMYCFYGQRIIDYSGSSLFTRITESNWHMLKNLKLKKIIAMIVQRSQKPNCFHAYGLVVLNLETFSMVRKLA